MVVKKFVKGIAKRVIAKIRTPAYTRKPKPVLTSEQSKFWSENGYLVLPAFFSSGAMDELNALIESLWDTRKTQKTPLVIDAFIGSAREQRMELNHAPDDARTRPYKLNDLYLEFPFVREMVLEKRLAAILEELLGAPPLIVNSLNFEFGSQQNYHTDSLYMTPWKDLNLAATWIALEDCHPDAGPLRYFPGSHKIPPYLFSQGKMTAIDQEMPKYVAYMNAEIKGRGLSEEVFCAKRGDVFIWHSQLYHGGSTIKNPKLTRRSLVTHYFCAKDLPGVHGTIDTGRYYFKRRHQPIPP
jgi:phytanoyl-CoA hydroxylase